MFLKNSFIKYANLIDIWFSVKVRPTMIDSSTLAKKETLSGIRLIAISACNRHTVNVIDNVLLIKLTFYHFRSTLATQSKEEVLSIQKSFWLSTPLILVDSFPASWNLEVLYQTNITPNSSSEVRLVKLNFRWEDL